MSGGAVDVTIRKRQNTLQYVPNANIQLLHSAGATDESCKPDYGEYTQKPIGISDEQWQLGVRNRRILYNVLNGLGLQVNPTEYWHWGWGDQMWAMLKGRPAALYGRIIDE